MNTLLERCAEHAHEINRAYCLGIGDTSQVPWADAPEWQRESARAGASLTLDHATPESLHENWVEHKLADGWTFGPVKDATAKTHPCMVPYADLPQEQRVKDHLFRAAVLGMASALGYGAGAGGGLSSVSPFVGTPKQVEPSPPPR